jgi:uncharacterized protein YjbJ (UPF0337 family)
MDKNQIKGEARKAKGKVKELIGRSLGNDKMEREGKLEYGKGVAQKGYGNTKDAGK